MNKYKGEGKQKWLNWTLLGIMAVLLVGGYAQASAQKAALVFDYPNEASLTKPTVLGDEDETENEQEDKDGEEQQEEQKQEEENRREEEKQREEERKETEIETQDGQKIKTKVEDDGTTKIEIEQDDLKLKYEVKNGEVNSIEEDEDEVEDELEDENEVEDESEDEGLEIETENERHTVRSRGVVARTNFPLSIDVATNSLIVATKDGPKVVAILPDQAVANLLSTGVVDTVDGIEELELQVQDREPVYQITGTKRYRFLAFIPWTQPVVTVVSAETGEVVATQQSVLANIVDFLSP